MAGTLDIFLQNFNIRTTKAVEIFWANVDQNEDCLTRGYTAKPGEISRGGPMNL